MDRKRSRSSSGWRTLSASARTRSLKASQESSRLINRASEWKSAGWISTGCTLVLTSALPQNDRGQFTARTPASHASTRVVRGGWPVQEQDHAYAASATPRQVELEEGGRRSRATLEPPWSRGRTQGRRGSSGGGRESRPYLVL